jgi:hypothetical protein
MKYVTCMSIYKDAVMQLLCLSEVNTLDYRRGGLANRERRPTVGRSRIAGCRQAASSRRDRCAAPVPRKCLEIHVAAHALRAKRSGVTAEPPRRLSRSRALALRPRRQQAAFVKLIRCSDVEFDVAAVLPSVSSKGKDQIGLWPGPDTRVTAFPSTKQDRRLLQNGLHDVR